MAKNYMKEVAHILGVELEEEFYIEDNNFPYKLNHNGLYFEDSDNKWQESVYLEALIKGKITIAKDILNPKEKEYLRNVIKPFRDSIINIEKRGYDYVNLELNTSERYEFLAISHCDKLKNTFYWEFPSFKENTMYKGMEKNREYTLEELGL